MREECPDFEALTASELSPILRQFYAEVRNQKGETYSKSSLVGIRAAIQRHLESPPFNITFNIITDTIFKPANLVFSGRQKQIKVDGKDKTAHKSPIQQGDMEKLYSSKTLSNENPIALQRKIYFEISLHFARRGREGLQQLRKDSFDIKTDDQGARYVTITYNEKSKRDQGDKKGGTLKEQRMYEQPNDPLCPVQSFELYLHKLSPSSDRLFQQPNPKILSRQ